MDESIAWLEQSSADRLAAEAFLHDKTGKMRCHAIAKWQQTVEKAVKAIIAALRESAVLSVEIGYRHEVERFISVLLRLPRSADNKSVQQHLRGLLDEATRTGIRALDALAPYRPAPGHLAARNTEYPFQNAEAEWTYPAAAAVFSADEIRRYRALAYRISTGARKIVAAIRRGPR